MIIIMPRVIDNKVVPDTTNNNEEEEDGGLKPPALPTPTTTTSKKLKSLQRSLKSTIQFKSDLSKSTRSTWSCGILHVSDVSSPPVVVGRAVGSSAVSSGTNLVKEEHCFVWISNLFHLDKALRYLNQFGFHLDVNKDDGDDDENTKPAATTATNSSNINSNSSSNVTFIPYSSRSNWCYKYPMAFPNIHVDLEGNVSGYPYWSSEGSPMQTNVPSFGADNGSAVGGSGATASSFKLNPTTTTTTVGATVMPTVPPLLPPPPLTIGMGNSDKMFTNASLSNEARSQLHSQMYAYFTWFKTELMIQSSMMMDATAAGTTTATADVTNLDPNAINGMIDGLGGLLTLMETTFGESVTNNAANKKRKASSQSMMAMMVAEDAPPLLESGLITPLNQLVAESHTALMTSPSSSPKRRRTKSTTGRSSGAGSGGNAPLDFDDMYNRLLTFKAEFGHVNVPQGYKDDKQLGSWVTNIRYKRKCLLKMGMEYEVDEEEDVGGGGGDLLTGGGMEEATIPDFDLGMIPPSTKKKDGLTPPSTSNKPKRRKKRLSQERVALLDQIGFAWSHDKQYKPWEERFNDLVEYKRLHGNTRVPRSSGSLGEWVHMQRKLYHKGEKNFMLKRAPKLESIGFEWRTRKYDLVSWDDNFQNLVKFGTENQHYNVPSPMDVSAEDGGNTQAQEEANRFYKWVKRTRAEYKSLMNGKTSRMLTEERVAKLRQIGFIV